ncbi:hypothetical protein [Nocardioides sp.]|uniref:hypothetical protein n=1 Tax=Nocardioides sp. TaxID=35761 RepID=UPI002ED5A2C3
MQPIVRFLRGFGRFWYDFIVGDDPKIAIGVAVVLGVGGVLVARETVSSEALVVVLAALLLTAFTVTMALDVSRHQRLRA